MVKGRKPRVLSSEEQKMMRAMGLKDVRQLDKMLKAPISEDAASHSEPPDEEYELAELAEAYAERVEFGTPRGTTQSIRFV